MYVVELAIWLEWAFVTFVLKHDIVDNYLPIFSILLC